MFWRASQNRAATHSSSVAAWTRPAFVTAFEVHSGAEQATFFYSDKVAEVSAFIVSAELFLFKEVVLGACGASWQCPIASEYICIFPEMKGTITRGLGQTESPLGQSNPVLALTLFTQTALMRPLGALHARDA